MKKSGTAASSFAVIVGIFLLFEGLFGLTSDLVFGIFSTNRIHAVIHIILGVAGIMLGSVKKSRGYCIFLGALLLLVGLLWFVPGLNELLAQLLNTNTAVAYFNILLGAVSLAVYYNDQKNSITQ